MPKLRAAFLIVLTLAACTPQQSLLLSLLPEGTTSILLSHLGTVADANRKKVFELEQKGDWTGLAAFAEENIARDRQNTDWWFVAGYAYSRLGRHARAAECYAEMVRIDPQDVSARHALAQAYRANGQPDRAARVLQQYLLVDRRDATTHLLLGESLSDMRRWSEAIPTYREALDLDGGSPAAWYGWGRAHARLGRMDETRQALSVLRNGAPALADRLAQEAGIVSGPSAPASGGAR